MANNTTSEVNFVSYYDFGSPRYRSAYNQSAKYVPDDYPYHDVNNGTYDAYYPLYRVTSSDPPDMYLETPDSINKITGDLRVDQYQLNNRNAQYGAIKGDRERPYNSNLELKTVSFNDWSNVPLNPGWDVIVGTRLVKLYGNIHTIENIHAYNLDNYSANQTSPLPKDIFVRYKGNIWRSLTRTFSLPPENPKQKTSFWQYIQGQENVFFAGIYNIAEGKTTYLYEEQDELRNFNPLDDAENSLICWNAAYFPN